MSTAHPDDIDADVRRQLDALGREITSVKRQRDALALDREQDRRQLAASDARNKYLEQLVAVVTRQRDFYMGSVIEITTHAGEIEHHYSRLRAATKAVMEMQKQTLPEEPEEPIAQVGDKTIQDAAEARQLSADPHALPSLPRRPDRPIDYAPLHRRLAGV